MWLCNWIAQPQSINNEACRQTPYPILPVILTAPPLYNPYVISYPSHHVQTVYPRNPRLCAASLHARPDTLICLLWQAVFAIPNPRHPVAMVTTPGLLSQLDSQGRSASPPLCVGFIRVPRAGLGTGRGSYLITVEALQRDTADYLGGHGFLITLMILISNRLVLCGNVLLILPVSRG